MTAELTPPLSSYFDATNSHDASAVAGLFGRLPWSMMRSGSLRPSMHPRLGAVDLRKYDVRLTPHDVHSDNEAMVVFTTVAGSFLEPDQSQIPFRDGWRSYRGSHDRLTNDILGDPNGTRTRVFAVKGRRPEPLDDGAAQER